LGEKEEMLIADIDKKVVLDAKKEWEFGSLRGEIQFFE